MATFLKLFSLILVFVISCYTVIILQCKIHTKSYRICPVSTGPINVAL